MDNTKAYLESNLEEGNYDLLDIADGTLLTENGHSFPIHKFLLAWRSRYFSDIFCGARKHEKVILIPGIRGEVLSNILTYIYKGKIHITEENICDVFVASHYLLLENLLSHTKTFLDKHLSVGNCLAVYLSALKINSTDFMRESRRFIVTHFEELVCSRDETFCELPLDILMQLLNDRNLRVQNENVVWRAVVKWVEADLSNRLRRVPDLLMLLRVSDVDDNLAFEILTHAVVAKNPFCRMIDLKGATDYKNALERYQCDPRQDLPLFKQRKPLSLNFIAYYCEFQHIDEVDIYVTYDENLDLWRKVMDCECCPDYLSCVEDCIYVFETRIEDKICYNIIEKEMVEFSDTRIPRSSYAFAQLDRFLYILGGQTIDTRTDIYDVEIYNPEEDAWHDAMPMFPVKFPSAVALNGSIYVVGKKPGVLDMIAQKYNPSTGIWNVLPNPSIFILQNFSLVVYHDQIYAIGEKNGDEDMRDVEVFNPIQNVWYFIQGLPYTYCFPRALVINDRLIVSEDPARNEQPAKNPPVQWNNDGDCWEAIEESSPLFNLHYYFFAVQHIDNLNAIHRENKMPTTIFEKSPFS